MATHSTTVLYALKGLQGRDGAGPFFGWREVFIVYLPRPYILIAVGAVEERGEDVSWLAKKVAMIWRMA